MKKLGPRRKRLRRASRLESAKHWIPTYVGKNIIRGYQNWYGVDIQCAVYELKMLKIKIDEQYVSRVLEAMTHRLVAKKRNLEKKAEGASLLDWCDSDENFYYIAGYTPGGAPYGITWEEAEVQGLICGEVAE